MPHGASVFHPVFGFGRFVRFTQLTGLVIVRFSFGVTSVSPFDLRGEYIAPKLD